MLYKFKSKVTGDVIMLEPNGRRLLEIVGKLPEPVGIILPSQMPEALLAIETAVEEEALQKELLDPSHPTKFDNQSSGDEVGLKQRMLPIVEMLKRSHLADVPVVWGV